MKSESILYILMRNDLPSMNVGKALAQASHASNAFVWQCGKKKTRDLLAEEQRSRALDWVESTEQGFGTVLVLAANLFEIERAMGLAGPAGLIHGQVQDPTYPYTTNYEIASLISTGRDTIPREFKNGQMLLWRREVTCAYVFGTKEETKAILGHLPLHP